MRPPVERHDAESVVFLGEEDDGAWHPRRCESRHASGRGARLGKTAVLRVDVSPPASRAE
jgi:hypothetical protein